MRAQGNAIQRLRHRIVQLARQALTFAERGKLPCLIVELGILDGHRRLVGDRRHQRHPEKRRADGLRALREFAWSEDEG